MPSTRNIKMYKIILLLRDISQVEHRVEFWDACRIILAVEQSINYDREWLKAREHEGVYRSVVQGGDCKPQKEARAVSRMMTATVIMMGMVTIRADPLNLTFLPDNILGTLHITHAMLRTTPRHSFSYYPILQMRKLSTEQSSIFPKVTQIVRKGPVELEFKLEQRLHSLLSWLGNHGEKITRHPDFSLT